MGKLLICILTLFLTGCFPSQYAVQESWLGKTQGELLAAKGTPSQIISDGSGGQIYSYIRESQATLFSGSIRTRPTAYTIRQGQMNVYQYESKYRPPQYINIRKEKNFWVDPNGIIYRVTTH